MSLKDNAYQKNKAQKNIEPLTSFLEDIQCLRGVKQSKKPAFMTEGKQVKTLDRMLLEAEADKEIRAKNQQAANADDAIQIDDEPEQSPEAQVSAKADEKEAAATNAQLYLGPNQRYFMGAGQDPLLTIVTSVDDKKIKYYQYPWKKEQVINKDIGQNLLQKGSQTWIGKNNESSEEDLKKSIEAVLAGKPGEKVSLDDYQFANIQVRYTGPDKGDDKPWEELEQKYNVNVGGVLSNKQTYNIRLTNRSLQKLEDEIRNTEPAERHFKIVKIMKEEEDFAYFIECVGIYPVVANPYAVKPKVSIREIPDEELEWFKKMVENGVRHSITFGDYKVGETVIFNDVQWTIAEFIPWMKEPAAMLVSIDVTVMADQVPLKKLRKMTPEEMSNQKSREEIVKGLAQITLEFPKSKPCGETQDIVKEVKQKKNKGTLKESLFEDKVEDLADFIDNDPDTYKKDFAPAARNLTQKWNEGSYNKDLALNSFKQIAESAGKRFFIANDGEYEGQQFGDPKQMFPEDIVNKVALVLRKSFENQANAGEIKEAIEYIAEGGKNKKPIDREAYDTGSMVGPTSDRGSDQADIDCPTIGGPIEEDQEIFRKQIDSYVLTVYKLQNGQREQGFQSIIYKYGSKISQGSAFWSMSDRSKEFEKIRNIDELKTFLMKNKSDDKRTSSPITENELEKCDQCGKTSNQLFVKEVGAGDDPAYRKLCKGCLNAPDKKEKLDPKTGKYVGVNNEESAPESASAPKVMKGQDSSEKENIPFTEKERAALKEASAEVKMDILNNAAVLSWDGSEGLTKITISKIPQPQQRSTVYSATATISGELDKERTINSDSFDTEDDVDILKDFLTKLKLNEEELDEAKKTWGDPVQHIKYVNSYPVRDERPIKSEVVGNVKYIYKLAKDIKSVEAGGVSNKKGRASHKSAQKKTHKHKTKVKLVSAYPVVDGKPLHSQTIGNITYRYKTKQSKKEDAEKRKAERKAKGKKSRRLHESTDITLVAADKNGAVISIDGKEQKIKRYQSVDSPSGRWVYTEFLSPEETDENKAGIMITKEGESASAPTKIESLVIGQTINL